MTGKQLEAAKEAQRKSRSLVGRGCGAEVYRNDALHPNL